ncbi:Response regulator receiver domain-containing protein [Mesorhizobium sp. NFR06]|uniref:response regulator n=1 Tax=Mesorhizobium sp. NFR06 TaxID=1566290 RepID=UPI0008E61C6F|nr:response regulator [Mesorhizobium sp. NFR06]SFQ07931.1 Response regulator receiver domain-containing protein [Mesorhizobium sp. NFR06]
MYRVLVVEDEWLIADDSAATLRRAGHQVVGPAPSVKAALECLSRHEINAALLDVQLFDETSFRIADQLQDRNIPFAFVTGCDDSKLPVRYAKVPVLQKPVLPHSLLEMIAQLASKIRGSFGQDPAG